MGFLLLKMAVAQRKCYWTGFGSFYSLGMGDRVWGHMLLWTNFISVLWDFLVLFYQNHRLEFPPWCPIWWILYQAPFLSTTQRRRLNFKGRWMAIFSARRFTLSPRGTQSRPTTGHTGSESTSVRTTRSSVRRPADRWTSGIRPPRPQTTLLWIDLCILRQPVDRWTSVIRPLRPQATLLCT